MKDITTQIIEDIIKSPDFEALKRKAAYLIKSAIQKDRRELVGKAFEAARLKGEWHSAYRWPDVEDYLADLNLTEGTEGGGK